MSSFELSLSSISSSNIIVHPFFLTFFKSSKCDNLQPKAPCVMFNFSHIFKYLLPSIAENLLQSIPAFLRIFSMYSFLSNDLSKLM